MIIALCVLLLVPTISFGETIVPTTKLAKETSAYKQISIEVERLVVTERQFKSLMNQMDTQLSGINRLISYGYENMLRPQFRLKYTRDTAMPNLEYLTATLTMNQRMIQNTMYIAVRNLYTGLYSAQKNYELAEIKHQIEKEKFEIDQFKYSTGLISDIELKKSEYALLEADIDFMEAKSNFEEMTISFNSFIGNEDLHEVYQLQDELKFNVDWDTQEMQIAEAMINRSEIVSIENDMKLNDTKKGIYESRGGSYLIFPDIELEYKKLNIENQKSAIELSQTKKTIAIEIEKDINELNALGNNLNVMTSIYDNQILNLEKFQLQNELGYLSDLLYREIENGILQFEVSYQLSIQNYNTQLLSHYYALNVGPSSEGGGF